MQTNTYPDGPRLLADIGGTNARFALETAPGAIQAVRTLACADHARFEDAVRLYLALADTKVSHAVIAIANPVDGDAIRMTNHHWAFSIEAARRALGLETLLVVNDFTALAMSLPALQPADLAQVGGGTALAGSTVGLVGAGTGLGVSGLVPSGKRWSPLNSEGGHVAFSPLDEREVTVLRHAWQRYDHVSAERFVSGPGLVLIREALAMSRGMATDKDLSPSDIVTRGLSGDDALSLEAIDCFCGMLGTVAATAAGVAAGSFLFHGIGNLLGNDGQGASNHLLADNAADGGGAEAAGGGALADQAGIGAIDEPGGADDTLADNSNEDSLGGFFDGDGSDEGLFG